MNSASDRSGSRQALLRDGAQSNDTTGALLLANSPKTRKSTSNSLGGYLFDQLGAHSIRTDTIYLHTVVRSPKNAAALEAVAADDLVTLAIPLYVDSPPSTLRERARR